MMDAQTAWLTTVNAISITNPGTIVQRAKFLGYQDGVLSLDVNSYVEAALCDKVDSLRAEFVKYSGLECRAVQLVNRDQPTQPTPTFDDSEELITLRDALDAANAKIAQLEADNKRLEQELSYHQEWGGGAVTRTDDGVFIDRDTLRQVGLVCLDTKTPRTAAPLFLYALSLADSSGKVALEAKTVCSDLLGIAKRSWAGLLGSIFGTLVMKDGHQLKVTLGRYHTSESNTGTLPTGESAQSESNTGTLPDENSNTGTLLSASKVTLGRYFPHVIMNDDDINKKSSTGIIQSKGLPPDTKKRLDERQRQLHAIGFNPEMAERYQQTIIYAPDTSWNSWLEQSNRSKNPAGLMCSKIKNYHQRRATKVIDLSGKAS